MKTKAFYLLFSLFFLLLALWLLMWFFSSSSLANPYCNSRGGFSLFHPEFRCRQPYVAAIGFILAGAMAIWLFIVGVLAKKRPK